MILDCKNLSKRFGGKYAVRDISLSLGEGSILGIIGPNGAGKSTLIKMITGLIWPDSGSATIHGFDVHRQHCQAMRLCGAIIEWPAFIPYLSAKRNLDILSGGHGKAYEAKLREITSFVDLDQRLNDKVEIFSTGMKQRLGIALALLPDSKFIILDEPTNGLDPGGIVEIRNIIRDYNRQFGVTVIITSHMLGEIQHICHEIALIRGGRIAAAGSLQELLHNDDRAMLLCNDPRRAQSLLSASTLPIREIIVSGDELHVHIDSDCLADINSLLVNAGMQVSRLELRHKSLEDFFIQNTTEDNDHVA